MQSESHFYSAAPGAADHGGNLVDFVDSPRNPAIGECASDVCGIINLCFFTEFWRSWWCLGGSGSLPVLREPLRRVVMPGWCCTSRLWRFCLRRPGPGGD